MKTILVVFFTLFATLTVAYAQSATGIWKTIDDKTGEAKSHVEVYEKNGKLYGKVVKLLLSAPDRTCDECKGDRKGKPVLGMLILEGLSLSEGKWKNGNIMDPENGNFYGCTLWLETSKPDELRVKGIHWTGLSRTQTWYRVK
jgi:uncharacterized protein (DUF2147 family)